MTLIEERNAVCWGTAYLVSADDRNKVLSHLNYREKGGYSLRELQLSFPQTGDDCVPGLIYIAGPRNPNWLGDAPLVEIAAQVIESVGPSGNNIEYVLELARALRSMQAEDPHVFDLANLIDAAKQSGQA